MADNSVLVGMARMWGDLEKNIYANDIHTFMQGWDDMGLARLLTGWAEMFNQRTDRKHTPMELNEFFEQQVKMLHAEHERKERLDASWEAERAPEPDVFPTAILVELDYKASYQRFALTPQEFQERYPETYAQFGLISDCNSDTLKPMVHIWFTPCTVNSEIWDVFFSDMEDGLPQSDIDAGNIAEIRLDEFGELRHYISPYTYIKANEHTGASEETLLQEWKAAMYKEV